VAHCVEDGGGGAAGLGVVVVELLAGVGRGVQESGECFEGLRFHAGVGELFVRADVLRDIWALGEGEEGEGVGLGGVGGEERVEVVVEEGLEGVLVLGGEGRRGCRMWDVGCAMWGGKRVAALLGRDGGRRNFGFAIWDFGFEGVGGNVLVRAVDWLLVVVSRGNPPQARSHQGGAFGGERQGVGALRRRAEWGVAAGD
jgi:hypothetical protein